MRFLGLLVFVFVLVSCADVFKGDEPSKAPECTEEFVRNYKQAYTAVALGDLNAKQMVDAFEAKYRGVKCRALDKDNKEVLVDADADVKKWRDALY